MTNGGGAVGTFVAMGVVYWIAYGMAMAVVVGVLGALMGAVVVIGLLINIARTLKGAWDDARSANNVGWCFDLLAAPMVGAVSAVAALPFAESVNDAVSTPDSGHGAFFYLGGLTACLLFWAGFLLAPKALAEPRRLVRLLGYAGFVVYPAVLTMAFASA